MHFLQRSTSRVCPGLFVSSQPHAGALERRMMKGPGVADRRDRGRDRRQKFLPSGRRTLVITKNWGSVSAHTSLHPPEKSRKTRCCRPSERPGNLVRQRPHDNPSSTSPNNGLHSADRNRVDSCPKADHSRHKSRLHIPHPPLARPNY